MKKVIITGMVSLMIMIVAQGCYKVATVQIDNSPAVTKTVSFKTDIIPIISKNCALPGCHNSGGRAPVLQADNAYISLSSGNYLNKSTPSKSIIYLWLTGKEAVAMPMGAENNPSNINALVLAWIIQGAKNN